MSKTIHLHCPSTNQTVTNFVISPFQSPDQIIQGIRLALQIPYAGLYTTDAKSLTKLDSIQNDQRVLVAASAKEIMLPDSPAEFEFYAGQEAEDADEWEWLSEREKCEHIMNLNENEPCSRNKLRITKAWEMVEDELKAVGQDVIDEKECENLIEQRWKVSIDHFLPDSMKPVKLKISGKFWDEGKVLAGLAVLSSFTHGQARLARGFLEEAVRMRIGDGHDVEPVVQLGDVVNAATIVYEKAGAIKEKLTKPKSAKAREKERKKALKDKARKGRSGSLE